MRFARSLLVLLVLSLIGLPAQAQSLPQIPGTAKSDNVTLLSTIPEPGVIGARFRNGVMYVTSTFGLTTWDVTTAATPKPLGRLPLPHFENEDVDLGGNILLLSTDAA
ncbi:MAG: hypothetical protein ICV72_09685 [Aldersonia sp.]|nr:hypothetical protein [Aldersonia sp.]